MLFNTSRHSRLLQHLIAILAVSLIAACLYIFISGLSLKPSYKGLFLANLGKGAEATERLAALSSALSDGKTVVVLGSSELTSSDLTFIPYNFLPNTLNIPVLAYGHAGFQSFAIHGLLAANADVLSPRTKLVIMVSPGWFNEDSIHLDTFIEHFQPQVLTQLYQDPEMRKLVGQYVKLHFSEFGKLTRYQEVFDVNQKNVKELDDADRFMRQAAIEDSIFSLKTKIKILLNESGWLLRSNRVSAPVFPDSNQWAEYATQAYKTEMSHMHNNQHWVRDDYFTKYLSDLPSDGKLYFNPNMDTSPEFSDLTLVLRFLQSKKVRALVVMQPLNPFVYKDAARAKPIAQNLAKLCQATGMQYFNMTVNQYEPGTLRDGMHLGELGWVQVDQQITKFIASK